MNENMVIGLITGMISAPILLFFSHLFSKTKACKLLRDKAGVKSPTEEINRLISEQLYDGLGN